MIDWIKKRIKASRAARLPEPLTAGEAMWNERTHNQQLVTFPRGTAENVRDADMKSKQVYDGLDEHINQFRRIRDRLKRARPPKPAKA